MQFYVHQINAALRALVPGILPKQTTVNHFIQFLILQTHNKSK